MRNRTRRQHALIAAPTALVLGLALAAPAWAAESPSPAPTAPASTAAVSASDTPPASASDASAALPGQASIESVQALPTGSVLDVTVRPPASSGTSPITSYDFSLNGLSWLSCGAGSLTCRVTGLQNGTTYFVVVRAVNASGPGAPSAPKTGVPHVYDPSKPAKLPSPRTWAFAKFNAAGNSLGVDGAQVRLGAGTLPKITYSTAIPDKAVVESHLRVTAKLPDGRTKKVKGAWGWLDDKTTVFRPENYWPGRSDIAITSTLARAVMGKSKGSYVVGSDSLDTTYEFQTARRMIIKVDGQTDRMKVIVDGVKKKVFPVSLGKSEWETRNGVKVISTDKEPTHTYTSTSLNLDTSVEEPYVLEDIPWNTRLTPTGEFIHSAPWAYGRIGRYNGSHGCTNMFESDAKWIYDNTIPGDVVLYSNTGGETVPEWNGPGGLWNIPWEDWLKKSALGSGSGTVQLTSTAQPAGVTQNASA